jgi:PmbA protein
MVDRGGEERSAGRGRTSAVLEEVLADVLRAAARAGATAADALAVESEALSVGVRLGAVEKLADAREKRVGVRVFVGRSSAVVSSADLSPESVARLASDAVALARATAADPDAGLPDPAEIARRVPDLGLYDPEADRLSTEAKIALAIEAEAAALGFDPAITNSEGAEFGSATARIVYGSTLGFVGGYDVSSFSLHVAPVAARDGAMQRDYWYTADRRLANLEPARAVGETAARRALRRLGARKVPTSEVPVVFDPETAATLLRHIAGAVAGTAVYRGTSFLRGRLGEAVAAPEVSVHDAGALPGALGSKPFDGEGVPTRTTVVIDGGVLRSYLLDSYSGRKLGLRTTGNAARSVGDSPGVAPTNLFMQPGPYRPEEIIGSVARGLYVTDLIGFGVNPVTGDYSRGAVGLWIENGTLTHAVEEVTIAGNLLDMLRGVEMIGNDLRLRAAISAPTLKIRRMTVAGS